MARKAAIKEGTSALTDIQKVLAGEKVKNTAREIFLLEPSALNVIKTLSPSDLADMAWFMGKSCCQDENDSAKYTFAKVILEFGVYLPVRPESIEMFNAETLGITRQAYLYNIGFFRIEEKEGVQWLCIARWDDLYEDDEINSLADRRKEAIKILEAREKAG